MILRSFVLVATISTLVVSVGCQSPKDEPTTFARKDAPDQTMTLLATHSIKWKLASFFHDVPHMGIYELKSNQDTQSGTYSYAGNDQELRYTFETEAGKRWTATLTNATLKDEQGNIWLRQKESVPVTKQSK